MNNYKLYGILMIIFGAFFYATKAIFVKLGFRDTPQDGLDMLMLRMLFSFPFYIAVLFIQHKKKKITKQELPIKKEYLIVGLTGFLGYYLASYWDFIGLQYITANLERVILFIYPSVVLLAGVLLYKRKVNKLQLIAIAIGWLGIGIAYYSDKAVSLNANQLKGSIYILAAGISYGLYLSLSENIIKKFGSLYYTALSMVISCLVVFIHYFIEKGFSPLFEMTQHAYVLGLLIAFFSTVIPAFLMSEGIQRVGSGNMSIIGTVGPIITILLSIYILGEKFTATHFIGTFLVLFSIYLITQNQVSKKS